MVDVKFQNPVVPLLAEEAGGLDYIAIARDASLGIMAICALVVLRMFRGAKRKVGLEAAAAKQLPGAEGAAGFLPGGSGSPEPLLLRKQIALALEEDPDRAKQLFVSWLEEKGGE